jgi:hypothetical protein
MRSWRRDFFRDVSQGRVSRDQHQEHQVQDQDQGHGCRDRQGHTIPIHGLATKYKANLNISLMFNPNQQ